MECLHLTESLYWHLTLTQHCKYYIPIELRKHTHKSFTPVSFHKISFHTKEFLFQISSLLFLPIVQISLQTSHLIKKIILTIIIKKNVFKFPYFLILRYAAAAATKLLLSCLTLCDTIHSSPPGSSVPGILQARILEWVAISFSPLWGIVCIWNMD